MRALSRSLGLLGLISHGLAGVPAAQVSSSQFGPGQTPVILVSAELVHVDAVVTDGSG